MSAERLALVVCALFLGVMAAAVLLGLAVQLGAASALTQVIGR